MAIARSEIEHRSPDRRWSWRLALVPTAVVAMAGLFFSCNQFFVNYLYDQNAHTRTLGGIATMLLGVVGVFLPILLFRNERHFLALRRPQRWLLVLGIPVLYVLVLIFCVEASLRSTELILPRPTLPTALLRYQAGDSRVEFRGRWGGGGGSNDAEVMKGVEHFSSHIDQGYIDGFLPGAPHHADRRIITIVGRAERQHGGAIQIVLDVDTEEPFQFAIENLVDPSITRGGQTIGNSVLESGKYQVTVRGRQKKGA